MIIELLGFVIGAGSVVSIGLILMNRQQRKLIRKIYGR